MSFILNDSDLIRQLLSHGQDFENRFTKQGQAAVDANAALNQILTSLENQLHPELRPPSEGPVISTQSDSSQQLTPQALEDLGALAAFLAGAKITVNGKQPVMDHDPGEEGYRFYRLEGSSLFEDPNRDITKRGFWINPELLSQYLVSLQSQLTKKPNKILGKYIQHLISQSNDLLGTQVNPQYQAPTPTLSDAQVLDTFPNALDPKNYVTDGPVQLKFGDIKSPEGLNAWINANNISVEGRMINHPQFDFCAVIQTIHNKAKWHLSRAANAQQKNMYTLYVQQVEKIAPSITGPDGKACQLSGASTTPGAGGKGEITQADIYQVVEALPLRTSDIDFNRIRAFFQAYRKILSPNAVGATAALGAMDAAEKAMQNAAAPSILEFPRDSFPLSATIQQVGTWLAQPKGQTQALGLVEQLRYVVSNTSYVILQFKNSGLPEHLGSRYAAAVNNQVGNDPTSQGIAGNNMTNLQVWEDNARAQSQQGSPPGRYRGW